MEQEKTAIEQQVKLQMQDAAYGTAPGYNSGQQSCPGCLPHKAG